jgi:hypothetical protein
MPVDSTALQTYLSSIGVSTVVTAQLTSYVTTAYEAFYAATGRKAITSASTTVKRYTLPQNQGRDVILPIDDVFTTPIVISGITATSSGTTLTYGTDYDYLPENAIVDSRPVEAIKFLRYIDFGTRAISVEGKLGLASSEPADITQGILAKAAALYLRANSGLSGMVSEKKQGDRTIKYETSGGNDTVSRLEADFDALCRRRLKMPYV